MTKINPASGMSTVDGFRAVFAKFYLAFIWVNVAIASVAVLCRPIKS